MSPIVERPLLFLQEPGSILSKLRLSKAARQTLLLFSCQIGGIILGFGVNLINTRTLGPFDYGLFVATFAATEFVTVFMDFGFLASGARLLALNKKSPDHQRRLIGALLIVGLVLSLLAATVLWTSSFFAPRLLNAPIGHLLRWFCMFLGLMAAQELIEHMCRGTGRIEALSLFNVASKGAILLLQGLAFATGFYSLTTAIGASLLGSLGTAAVIFYRFGPRFKDLKPAFRELCSDVKSYGAHAYAANVTYIAGGKTDSLILSHFATSTAVGYYRLAALVMTPMISLSRAVSTTLFSRFVHDRKVSDRVLLANGGWLALCFLGVITVGGPVVRFIFGMKYAPACKLLPLVALATLLNGMSQPFDKFLGAKGKGPGLRKMAMVTASCTLVLNFIFIPKYGMLGACYSAIVGYSLDLLLHLSYYRYTVRHLP